MNNPTKITPQDRLVLRKYLKRFYGYYPNERYTIFNYVRFIRLRLNDKKDMWTGVSGDTGNGKSLFVLMVIILFGARADLNKNITYMPTGNEIINKLCKMKKNIFLIDEAARQLRKIQWQDKQQQKVNTSAMTERYKNNAVFANMPNFDEFTRSLRLGSMQFRAIVPYRTKNYARVIIQRKSRNWRSQDPWCDKKADESYVRFEKKYKEITNDNILSIERSQSVYVMDFIIPNLELILPRMTDMYDFLKIDSRNEGLKEELKLDNKKDRFRLKYKDVMIRISKLLIDNQLDIGRVKVTKTEIAKSLGISTSTLNNFYKSHTDDKNKYN